MSKFNITVNNAEHIKNTPDTINAAGVPSFNRNNIKQDIANVVLSSMLNGNSFYELESERLKRIEELCSDPELAEYVAKTMVYTRTTGNLRSISHFLAILLVENAKGTDYLRPALIKSFIRGDDLVECLALWNSRNPGKMVPNSLRRAFKDSLETFNDYSLKKYSCERSAVKLRDVVKLARPNPEKSKGNLKALINGTLPNISTAQTVNAGSTGSERATNYKTMLQEKSLGYMAAVKNIKNILLAGADKETINLLCDLFRNEKACIKSKLFPFRFVDAYKELKTINFDRILIKQVIVALEDGFKLSAQNVELVQPGESCAILLDESGSMDGNPFNQGKALMASMLTGLDKSRTVGYLWADNAREISVNSNPFDFIDNTSTQGGGTDLGAALQNLIDTNTKVDTIVILTDMQQTYFRKLTFLLNEYKKISPNVKVLFWNLQGYNGGTPIKLANNILEVCGFSDKLIDVAAKMLKFGDINYLVKEIESINL